jgi:Domain of unknown function (DUF4926)
MNDMIALLEVVALTGDMPEQGLLQGQVDTIVDALAPETFLIEFSDNQGKTYAMLPLKACQLIVLHFEAPGLQSDCDHAFAFENVQNLLYEVSMLVACFFKN